MMMMGKKHLKIAMTIVCLIKLIILITTPVATYVGTFFLLVLPL